MNELEIDKLKIYCNKSVVNIKPHISIRTPSLNEVVNDIGERKYMSAVAFLCSTPSDLMAQLDDVGVDFTTITEYELFIKYIYKSLDKQTMSVLFGDVLDFEAMEVQYDENIKDYKLVQHVVKTTEIPKKTLVNKIKKLFKRPIDVDVKTEEYDIVIDKLAYKQITDTVRTIHGLKKNIVKPMTETTKRVLIDMAREDMEIAKGKPYQSQLFDLISTMVNMEGFKRNDEDVFDMNIFAFFNSVKRIQKINIAKVLLQSGYSGFGVNLKDVKKEINYFGSLEEN